MSTFLPLITNTLPFNEILGNGETFIVPKFQRDYAWEEEQWAELWDDIIWCENNDYHFMGYLLFQRNEENQLIIDGQQRLTTLSIFILSGLSILRDYKNNNKDSENNQERFDIISRRFIAEKNPSNLKVVRKLVLNRNNDDFFKRHLAELNIPPNSYTLNKSNKLLKRAYEFFYEKFLEKFPINDESSGYKLSNFITNISKKIIFTTITVQESNLAYRFFETLNARGIQLSNTDLLKNLLFSLIEQLGEFELQNAEESWFKILEILKEIRFSDYLRDYWNSYHKITRNKDLFKEIKGEINKPQLAKSLLNELELNANIYYGLFNPRKVEFWSPKVRGLLSTLNLFGVSQCFPLILTCYKKLKEDEFEKVVEDLVIISLRYNIISGLNPNKLEDVYNQACTEVYGGRVKTSHALFKLLERIYVSDSSFKQHFEEKEFSSFSKSKDKIKYILCEIENTISGTRPDVDNTNITIEHIEPISNSQAPHVNRIGNLTLLEKSINSKLGSSLPTDKLPYYKNSNFVVTNSIIESEIWDLDQVSKRQKYLSEIAVKTWKIRYN